MTFGQRIKELRRQLGLTQRQVAEQAGLDFTYLSKMENDRLEHTPSIKAIQDLARALQVDELELMEIANKLPRVLEGIAGNKEALRFFRRTTTATMSPEVWRELNAYLDRHDRSKDSNGQS